MAQRVNVQLIDDIDQTEAAETVTFALDGVSYEIDLSEQNAQKLRNELATWIEHGRRVSGRRSTGRKPRSGQGSGSDTTEIRAWAEQNGYTVSKRGRVSAEIREAYEKAHA